MLSILVDGSTCEYPRKIIELQIIASWMNLASGIELWHRGMVGGVFSPSSIVEIEAKRASRRSAFSLGVSSKMSFPIRNSERDQN